MKTFILVILMMTISMTYALEEDDLNEPMPPFTIGVTSGLKYIQGKAHLMLMEKAVIDGEIEHSLTITTLNDVLQMRWLFESYLINIGNHFDFVMGWNAIFYNPGGGDFVNWHAANEIGPLGLKPYIKTERLTFSTTFMLWHTFYNKRQEYLVSVKPRLILTTLDSKYNFNLDVYYFYKYYPMFLKIEDHSFQFTINYSEGGNFIYGLTGGGTFRKGPVISDYKDYFISLSITLDKTKGKKIGSSVYRY